MQPFSFFSPLVSEAELWVPAAEDCDPIVVLCDGEEGDVADGEAGEVVEGVVPWDPAWGSLGVVDWANAASPSTRVRANDIAICFMLFSSISITLVELATSVPPRAQEPGHEASPSILARERCCSRNGGITEGRERYSPDGTLRRGGCLHNEENHVDGRAAIP